MQESSSYHYGSTWAGQVVRDEEFRFAQAAFATGNLDALVARLEAQRQERARQKASRAAAVRREQSFLLLGTLAASIARTYRARMVELTGR